MKDAVYGKDRHAMSCSKGSDALAAIFLNGGGDRGDEGSSPDSCLWIEMALAAWCFSRP